MTVVTQQSRVIEEMKNVLDRAAIRDSNLYRGFRRAALLAVYAPEILNDPEIDDEHKAWLRDRLALIRGWLREDWEVLVAGRGNSREEFFEDIARALDPERIEERYL